MNLLQFSGDEIGTNGRLHTMFTTRRKPSRRHSPAIDGLEGRQLLSALGSVAEIRMTPASPAIIKKMVQVAVVQSTNDQLAGMQKIRDAATTIVGAGGGTNVPKPDILFPVFAQ